MAVTSKDGKVYKLDYQGCGKFSDPTPLDFHVDGEGPNVIPIMSAYLGNGEQSAYGFPKTELQDPKAKAHLREASLVSSSHASFGPALPAIRVKAETIGNNKYHPVLAYDRNDKRLGYYRKQGKNEYTAVSSYVSLQLCDSVLFKLISIATPTVCLFLPGD